MFIKTDNNYLKIVHIAAYTPTEDFTQHVMPLMNLNPAARQRHQIRVITVGFFRMMKSMQTYKVIKIYKVRQTTSETLNIFCKLTGYQN